VNDPNMDSYEQYEDLFNPMKTNRQARRKRKPQANHKPKKAAEKVIGEIADLSGVEGDYTTTYQPSKHERGWLLKSLRPFYDQAIITDVLAVVKGGKEASVYRCAAHPSTNMDFVAAKVYRPRMFRQLRNDKLYRQGRVTLKADGKAVKKSDQRVMRALGKKSAFGVQTAHTSWLMYEYKTLQLLYSMGAAVPEPLAAGENAIMMEYCGNAQLAAPTLNTIVLAPEEPEPLFNETLRNVELMLQHNLIHGDLSAYNILYWEGYITLIDFPQVTDSHANTEARFIFERDVTRICQYFASQGLERDANAIVDVLWEQYGQPVPEPYPVDDYSLDDDDDDLLDDEWPEE
jgi:RIO kinase 1